MINEVSRTHSPTLDPLPQQAPERNKVHAFFEHLREGRLTTTHCDSCDVDLWPPRSVCPTCFRDDLSWVDLPTGGRIVSMTVQEAGASPEFPLPMVFALLEFTAEIRFIGRILAEEPAELHVGEEVGLRVVEVPGDRVLPAFAPIG